MPDTKTLNAALDGLRAQVKAGLVSPEHLQAITREIFTDPMTGMGNRKAYADFLSRPRPGVHVRIDGNDFGSINKQHGFEAGDAAITAMGTAIREALRETVGKRFAKSYRLGGDEFHLHVPDVQSAARFSRRVREKLESIAPVGGTHGLALSIGLGGSPEQAEQALIKAKAAKSTAGYKLGQSRTHVHSLVAGNEGAVPVDHTVKLALAPPTVTPAPSEPVAKSDRGSLPVDSLAKMAPKVKTTPPARYGYHGTEHGHLPSIAQRGLDPGFATEDEDTAHGYATSTRIDHVPTKPVVLRFPYPADARPSENYVQRLMDEGDTEEEARAKWNHEFSYAHPVAPHLIEWRHAGEWGKWKPLAGMLAKMAPKTGPRPLPTREQLMQVRTSVLPRTPQTRAEKLKCEEVSASIHERHGVEHVLGHYNGPEVGTRTYDPQGYPTDPRAPYGHSFNIHHDGTIIDATADQFGDRDPIRIIPPGDPRHAWYLEEKPGDPNRDGYYPVQPVADRLKRK